MRKLFNDYGTIIILLLLCAFLSWRTMNNHTPEGPEAGRQVADAILAMDPKPRIALIAIRNNTIDERFAAVVTEALEQNGIAIAGIARGNPANVRTIATTLASEGRTIDVVAATAATAAWPIFDGIAQKVPQMTGVRFAQPDTYRWPTFLMKDNLINISNQTVVISTIAIGMTMVIITGGIELSVGSLIALSSCLAAWFIRRYGGATEASTAAMVGFSALAILICGCMGLFTGAMVTLFAIPPFIVTLATMMVASGFAYMISSGYTIFEIPDAYTFLGRGTLFWGIPISVCICLLLYVAAHILMSCTSIGRYIYAVGGNKEAARLSGVPVRFIFFFVYVVIALLAGFGGIITASQLKAGAPIYGVGYEMFVIASTVVGGTSLAGGEGKIFGTLIGSFIIATIQNGMNLLGVESYTQKVVLGMVILIAVLLDRLKQTDFFWKRRKARAL
ncbi:MAG: ABC transporter permease [Planctomycetaceae bacterium]|nr:ABC transporter permease [Planctomycetaceae bacterium]